MIYGEKDRSKIRRYIQSQIKLHCDTQQSLAKEYGCDKSIISGVVSLQPNYCGMKSLRQFIAKKLGRTNWQQLITEALAQEEITV